MFSRLFLHAFYWSRIGIQVRKPSGLHFLLHFLLLLLSRFQFGWAALLPRRSFLDFRRRRDLF